MSKAERELELERLVAVAVAAEVLVEFLEQTSGLVVGEEAIRYRTLRRDLKVALKAYNDE